MSQLESAIAQIRLARSYVDELLSHIDPSEWFRQPKEGVTHVAWQVGHLAVAQYSLALKRVRGETTMDATLVSPEFLDCYGKGSLPSPNPADNFAVKEVRNVADQVHAQVLTELQEFTDEQLAVPSDPRHPMFETKLGALQWCAQHEFTHAGQISLLRRLFGEDPLW
ncbi:MAG: DinB family protein [Pirellulaceae bacterium]|jgi:uncharacterized damage-inducible protein DinB|nr:DinB family protein [Pirellulaceae bacterium]MDP6554511.1 DinB family protein [Pirellulaceae bacterium]MDP6718086.1 DinB family protein [Pirellulaceae bacterium]